MPQNDNKPVPRVTAWTKKHDEYCLQYKIPNSAQKLWHWLICYGQVGKRIEPSLKEFNDWIESERGKPYCYKQLKNAFNKLLECKLLKLIRQYNWHEFKLIIKPLDWLEPRNKTSEKKSEFENSNSKTQAETIENQSKNLDTVYQQQHSIDPKEKEVANSTRTKPQVSPETKQEIKQLCKTADIQLPEKCEIFYYPIEEIKISLGFLKIRNKRDRIPNRIGWIIDCLQNKYYLEPENQRVLQHLGIISVDSLLYEYYV
ncbi:MAG: hypothetical protein ACR2LR_03305 [Hassallia sp.]